MINPLFAPYDLFALFINNWAEGEKIIFKPLRSATVIKGRFVNLSR